MSSVHSSESGVTGRPTGRRHSFAPLLAVVPLLAGLLLLSPAALGSTPAGAAAAPSVKAGLSKVTIESARQRAVLRRGVRHFVASVIARQGNESLVRWNQPVCPLVAGLPRNFGEFILARISQAARAAGAPLAGSSCRANLFVIATAHPERVLKSWLARDPQIETRHGIEPVQSLLGATQPVRVWYNIARSCGGAVSNGTISAAELGSMMGSSSPGGSLGPSYCQNGIDTHLSYGDVRSIYSAILIVDTSRLGRVTIGQLADYLSLVGLVSIRAEADGEGAPTILRLFHAANAPQGLTPWDQALLYSLYNTSQSGKLQLTDMESVMVARIAP